MAEIASQAEDWKEVVALFETSECSIVRGSFKGEPRLGLVWNDDQTHRGLGHGFPFGEKGRATFLALPRFLEIHVLHSALDEVARNPKNQIDAAKSTKFIVDEIHRILGQAPK